MAFELDDDIMECSLEMSVLLAARQSFHFTTPTGTCATKQSCPLS